MALADISGRWAKEDRLSYLERILGVSMTAVALFGLFALALYNCERRSLARWARLGSVIDKSGLQLSPDAKYFCGIRADTSAARLALLPWGTNVETLESLVCDGNQLIHADPSPPAIPGRTGPFLIDRVRVLNGPNAGSEGWVLEYGLVEK